MGKFNRVCVFCGSSSGNRKVFGDAAIDLGRELVKRNIDLIYGGGSLGLMGLVSQTAYDGGCHVLGIIPRALAPVEISGHTVGEVMVVNDMHKRKAEMSSRADAFIALPGNITLRGLAELVGQIQELPIDLLYCEPVSQSFLKLVYMSLVWFAGSRGFTQYAPKVMAAGGYGTMEELLEIITWCQLGVHNKPIGLLNVDGYYDCLLGLFDKGVEDGFIKHPDRNIVISANSVRELIEKMEECIPLHDQVGQFNGL